MWYSLFYFRFLKMDIFQQGITALVAGFIGVVGFVFAGFSKRLDYVEKRQTNHELHIVANYVQDADLKMALEPLFKKLDRMEIKLDDANSKLAEKQDRPR